MKASVDQIYEVMKAYYEEGKTIQAKVSESKWMDFEASSKDPERRIGGWYPGHEEYRIKRQPRTFKLWRAKYSDGSVGAWQVEDPRSDIHPDHETITVEEIIND